MRLRRLLKDSAVYLIAQLLVQVASLLTFPLYTRALGVDDYGRWSLVLAFLVVSKSIALVGMNTAVMKFVVGASKSEKAETVGSALAWVVLVGLIVLGTAWVWGSDAAALLLGGDTGTGRAIAVIVAAHITLDAMYEIAGAVVRAEGRAARYAAASVVRAASTVLFGAALVLQAKLGVMGAVAAAVSAVAAGTLVMGAGGLGPIRAPWPPRRLLQMLRVGTGLVPANLSSWVLDVADRYLLLAYTSVAAVGVYSAGYRIGALVTITLVQPFHYAYVPLMLEAAREDPKGGALQEMADLFVGIGGLIVGLVTAAGPLLLTVLAGSEYVSAYPVIGPVAMGCLLVGCVTLLAPGVLAEGQTQVSGMAFGIGAAANVALNFILIPRVGTLGAALSTLATYWLVLVLYVVLCRFWSVSRLPVRRLAVILAWMSGAVVAASLLAERVPYAALGGGLAVAVGAVIAGGRVFWAGMVAARALLPGGGRRP